VLMIPIPSHNLVADHAGPRCRSGCCAEARRQCFVICSAAGQGRNALDRAVLRTHDLPQALVVRVEETSGWTVPVAGVRAGGLLCR